MTDFKTFKHRVTGKYGTYPAHFEVNPDFIPCEPGKCEDCQIEEPDDEVEDPPEEEFYDYYKEGDLT